MPLPRSEAQSHVPRDRAVAVVELNFNSTDTNTHIAPLTLWAPRRRSPLLTFLRLKHENTTHRHLFFRDAAHQLVQYCRTVALRLQIDSCIHRLQRG